MIRLITSIILCLQAIASFSQTAEIEVSYTALSPNFKNGEVDVKNQYVLLANTSESKFFSPLTEYIDSLKSTPEGTAKLNRIARAAVSDGKFDGIPQKDGSYYIVKSIKDDNMRCYDSSGIELFYYDDSPDGWEWKITDSTKNVLGYECIKAIAHYHGREWEAWFSPEIPISNGPWKLQGLPGLILEASADSGQYTFMATGLQQTSRPIIPIYNADKYEKTDRISFLKARRAFLDNPIGAINAQFGGGIKPSAHPSRQIFAPSTTTDLIETDYH